MGLSDTIKLKYPCIICGYILTLWETKDTACESEIVSVTEVNNFYCPCDECGAWNEYYRRPVELTEEQKVEYVDGNFQFIKDGQWRSILGYYDAKKEREDKTILGRLKNILRRRGVKFKCLFR